MHKWLLIVALLFSTTGQAETYRLTVVGKQDHLAGTQPAQISEPLLIMPFSVVSKPKPTQHEISYTSHNGSIFVDGQVNGIPMRFVVDTGASLVVIPPAIAEQAGIDTTDSRQARLQTANGVVTAPMVTVDQVIADNVAIEQVPAVIKNVSAVPDLGLLGMSFFGRHKMTIDHERQVIVLEAK